MNSRGPTLRAVRGGGLRGHQEASRGQAVEGRLGERERRHKTTSEADWSLSENPSVTSGRAVSMERRGESQVMLG